MITYGTYRTKGNAYPVIISNTKRCTEIVIANANNTIESAYKIEIDTEYSYKSNMAKTLFGILNKGMRGCTSKNAMAKPFVLGMMISHETVKGKTNYQISFYNNELCAAYVNSEDITLDVYYSAEARIPIGIPYVELMKIDKKIKNMSEDDLTAIPVRSVEEIALEKEDTTWLAKKKYFVVQDDETAEKIFSFLDKYKGTIAYDVETTGLKINMFGKVGSKYAEDLKKYNEEHKDNQLRVDRLCGIIFCVEENVSYYFPCFSRKYEVLYQNKESATRRAVVDRIKARYTIGDKREDDGDEARYIRNTPSDQLREDVILMERVRDILEKGYIESHGGSFEYKNGLTYDIDTNIQDDTMIMHQVMYKFRSNVGGRGEPSNLKFLSKNELDIDQWSLKDFFPSISEKDSGKSKTGNVKNKASLIDFSYMDLAGTRIYAPADGDCTFLLGRKYKQDLVTRHSEQQFLYQFEMVVLLAIGYMEFYGHRINEHKIQSAKDDTEAKIASIESEIRQSIEYASEKEISLYNSLKQLVNKKKELQDELEKNGNVSVEDIDNTSAELVRLTEELRNEMESDPEKIINLNSPAQVAELFYDKLKYELKAEKKSVGKAALKPLLSEKNEDGSNKYPVVHLYSAYKKEVTLLTKFFDNLPDFMYPGGFIFSSYGQISTNTGRMSCSKPNAQQYPKSITKIVEPREGFVMCDADYSQIEYRTLTGMAGNKYLLDLFHDPDNDYHTLMASLMYGVPYEAVTKEMRSAAKSFNFGIPYGMGFASLAILLTGNKNPESIENAKEKYEMYFKNQPETKRFFDDVKEAASVNKYTKTLWNRYRWYSFERADGTTDSRKRGAALRQAGNAVIQGTAADIFKISVARQFTYIRNNHLLGKFLIINMIHDEQLMEIDARYLNPQRILRDIGINMQFHIDGMPPLFIGAGFGKCWGTAKSSEAEIHPELLEELSLDAEHMPIFREVPQMDINTNDVVKYFDDRNYAFRKKKVIDYITNPNNFGKNLHPAIGSLINMQFSEGRSVKQYANDHEFLMANLQAFIDKNNINVKAEWFVPNTQEKEEDTDEGYEDDEDAVEVMDDYDERNFTIITDDKMYGSDVVDLIKQFKICVIKHLAVCGIDTSTISRQNLDTVCNYLGTKACKSNEDGALQVIFVKTGNAVTRTGIYVKNVNSDELERMYSSDNRKRSLQEGDIETRAVR